MPAPRREPPPWLSVKTSREKNVIKAARTQCLTPGSSPGPATWLLGAVTGAPEWGQTDSRAAVCNCLRRGGRGWGGRESQRFHYFPTYDFCLTYIIYRKTEICYPQGITFCGFTNGWISDLVIVLGLKALACFDQRLIKCTLKWILARQTSAH